MNDFNEREHNPKIQCGCKSNEPKNQQKNILSLWKDHTLTGSILHQFRQVFLDSDNQSILYNLVNEKK